METVTIGIDLGKNTGVAVLKDKKVILTHPIKLYGVFGERYFQLYKEVRAIILRLEAMGHRIGMVGIEEPPYVKNFRTFGELSGYLATLIILCERRLLPWMTVNNKTIKKDLCGHGNANKKAMYIEAMNIFEEPRKITQDEADAVLVGYWVELFREAEDE